MQGNHKHAKTMAAEFESCLWNLQKAPPNAISTGIGYLDHMLDQFSSHAQIGVKLTPIETPESTDPNRNANTDQPKLLATIGTTVGNKLRDLLADKTNRVSTFYCPLDEALVKCVIRTGTKGENNSSLAFEYNLAPYGVYPRQGRSHIGSLQTASIEQFWRCLASAAGINLELIKLRGANAHHIVESSFKAFCRATRNLLDDVDTISNQKAPYLYASGSSNEVASLSLARVGTMQRKTKETSIEIDLKLDSGKAGILIDTGVAALDIWFREFALASSVSLRIKCQGDTYIDEHHTAEDVAIAVGQAWNTALGSKAGLNRMWCYKHKGIHATVDLSNRPCLTHNLQLDHLEFVAGDLSCEMFEHVLESLTMNARMTVHLIQCHDGEINIQAKDYGESLVTSTAIALGHSLKYCCMVDQRRAGATASSKGTLSV